MRALAWLAVAAAVVAVVPACTDRLARARASSRVLAVLALSALAGMAMIPVALAVCFGPGWDHPPAPARLLGWAVAVGAAARALGAWRRVRRTWADIAAAVDVLGAPRLGGLAVVPLAEPVAFVAGRTGVVSASLLGRLTPEQQRAVVAHEEGHLAGGHPRLALAAHALARSVLSVPPARRAEDRLHEELEAMADDAAVEAVGDAAVVAAALAAAGRPGGAAILGAAGGDVAHRILRLTRPRAETRSADKAVLAAAAVTGAVALAAVCLATHPGLAWVGAAVCGGALVAFARLVAPLARFRAHG